MTRDEWLKRYVARMVQGGSWKTEAEATASIEADCDSTEQTGATDPSDWEDPESLADEHLEGEASSDNA